MPPILRAYDLPTSFSPEDLRGGTAVVIDVLRASTTIVHALEAGASEVIPCLEVEDARQTASEFAPGDVVLGGERGGVAIEGFDCGNSPLEYTPDRVAGRTVVFTTTNGTRAALQSRLADRVLIGAFANVSAVAGQLAGCERIFLVCAGTRGRYGRDDVLLAGLLIELVLARNEIAYDLNDQAAAARGLWRSSFDFPSVPGAEPPRPPLLAEALRDSFGGRNLTALGQEDDLRTAAEIDRFAGVPELDRRTLRIRLA